MEIVITFGVHTAVLKKSVENGHFRAISLMKFSIGWQVSYSNIFSMYM